MRRLLGWVPNAIAAIIAIWSSLHRQRISSATTSISRSLDATSQTNSKPVFVSLC